MSGSFLIADGHLDLGFSALQVNRDLTQRVITVRAQEMEQITQVYGTCQVTLPALREAGVGLVCATVMSRVDPADRWTGTGMYCQAQCHGIGMGHLSYYEELERSGEVVIVRTRGDLESITAAWRRRLAGPHDASRTRCDLPVGLVVSMESADPILSPEDVGRWHERGLRMVGIAHYGRNTYAHGTSTEGGLLPPAGPLLEALAHWGIIVDLTHLADQAFWEVLQQYEGPVACSHHNCRALVPGQRQLTDEMIRAVSDRGGVIGTALDAWMLDRRWRKQEPPWNQQTTATLETVVDHIEHVSQVTGSVEHCALGSDLDGGFGAEQSPRDLETIAGLSRLPALLARRGFSADEISAITSGNWIRLLGRALR